LTVPASGCDAYGELGVEYAEVVDKMNARTFYQTNNLQDFLDGLPYYKDAKFYKEDRDLFLLNVRRIKINPI